MRLGQTLREYPEIAIFLALSIGFWVGNLKFKKFSLGVVTTTLLAGVLIGQLRIEIPSAVKSTFFLMFLFAVGYGVGPQFFRGLKRGGISQLLFAGLISVACLLTAVLMAKLLHLDVGLSAGMLSGASTNSAELGVATGFVGQLEIPGDQKKAMLDSMPVAYAVTYLFGTAGAVWILASLGPRILRCDLAKECREYETKMGAVAAEPGVISSYSDLGVRAFRVSPKCKFLNRPVVEAEHAFAPFRIFIERFRVGNELMEAGISTLIREGQIVAISARPQPMLQMVESFGPETDDPPLLDFPVETVDVVVTKKTLAGRTLQEIVALKSEQFSRGVFLRKLTRSGIEMPFNPGTIVERGDILTLHGAFKHVERVIADIGYADRSTPRTDMTFMALGIALGALIGAITIRIGGIPFSLSASGGALFAGLVCGWSRSVHRTFGQIPESALWVFNNVGLTAFIAAVGINAGPAFISGLRNNGLALFVAGFAVTTIPLLIGIVAGKYLFKFHPAILLGACAGARTVTAALGAIQDTADSKVPALGYTVPYAVGNTLMTIWGVVIISLMK